MRGTWPRGGEWITYSDASQRNREFEEKMRLVQLLALLAASPNFVDFL